MANKFLTPLAYDPSQVSLLLGGWAPYGWASDTKIEVSKAEDNVLVTVGTDNDLSLALNRNNSVTIRICCMLESLIELKYLVCWKSSNLN